LRTPSEAGRRYDTIRIVSLGPLANDYTRSVNHSDALVQTADAGTYYILSVFPAAGCVLINGPNAYRSRLHCPHAGRSAFARHAYLTEAHRRPSTGTYHCRGNARRHLLTALEWCGPVPKNAAGLMSGAPRRVVPASGQVHSRHWRGRPRHKVGMPPHHGRERQDGNNCDCEAATHPWIIRLDQCRKCEADHQARVRGSGLCRMQANAATRPRPLPARPSSFTPSSVGAMTAHARPHKRINRDFIWGAAVRRPSRRRSSAIAMGPDRCISGSATRRSLCH
jgi:hypothetical protein